MDEMLVGLVLTDMGDGHETGEAALGASLPALPANATSQSEARGLTGLNAGPIVHKRIGAGTRPGKIMDVSNPFLFSTGSVVSMAVLNPGRPSCRGWAGFSNLTHRFLLAPRELHTLVDGALLFGLEGDSS